MEKKNYNIFLVCMLLFLIVSLGGCFNKTNDVSREVDWEEEVLYAKECGMDRLPCCSNGEAPCLYEQTCCVDPNNPKRNMCVDECTCGGLNDFCCAEGQRCNNGLACVNGYCVACGDDGQPCCDTGDECNNKLVCHSKKCVQCGLADNPCCDAGKSCATEKALDNTRAECQSGVCILCGFASRKGCFGEPVCNSRYLLNNNNCLQCGGYSQPCCNQEEEKCDEGFLCDLGFCSKQKDQEE